MTPAPVTRVTSPCSKLSEGETKDLCSSVGALAARSIEFKAVSMLPTSDPTVVTGRAVEFKQQLQNLANQVRSNEQFSLLTHTLWPGMVEVVVDVLQKCVDTHI